MAGLNKKRPVFATGHVGAYLDSISKAALADLVVDLVRAAHGEETADYQMLALLSDAIGPVAAARGDKIPTAPAFFRALAARVDKSTSQHAGYNVDTVYTTSLRAKAAAYRAVADATECAMRSAIF